MVARLVGIVFDPSSALLRARLAGRKISSALVDSALADFIVGATRKYDS